MSGIDDQGTPPEVPEEYAAVYRDAYQRALEAEDVGETGLAAELLTSSEDREERERPSWAVPAAVGTGALVLVLCAFVLGRMLSSDDPDDTAAQPAATNSRIPASSNSSGTPSRKPSPTKPTKTAKAGAWDGEVTPVAINAVTATCTSKPGTDSAGKQVRYDAGNAIDGDPTTAWRCDGTAIGTVLTLTLPTGTEVGEVGLIPGYAKTDPKSGADRYAENNRITKVRWTLADGSVVVQKLSPDPDNRKLQVLRVPKTTTGTITMEILAVDRGRRNTTAISEFGVSRTR